MRTILTAIAISFICCFMHITDSSLHAQTKQQWNDSISVINKLLESKPNSLELRMRKAEAHVMLEQWRYALEDYNSILVLHPKHIGALYFRAYVYMQQRKYEQACSDYHDVLKLAPNHKGALEGLALSSLYDQHLQDAFDYANILVENYPTDASSFSTRALVEEKRDMNDLALEDTETAIKLETEALHSSNTAVQANDDLCIYVRQRLAIHKKMKNSKAVEIAIATLTSSGMSRNMAAEICK